MKLARQIIGLSAAGVMAIGLALVLISGIVLTIETTGHGTAARAPHNATHRENVRTADRELNIFLNGGVDTSDGTVVVGEHQRHAEALEQLAEDRADALDGVTDTVQIAAINATFDGLVQAEHDLHADRIAIANAMRDETVRNSRNIRNAALRNIDLQRADTIREAFLTVRIEGAVITDANGGTQFIEMGGRQVLTPMAATLVSGLVLTLAGLGVAVALVATKKCKEEEAPAPAKK